MRRAVVLTVGTLVVLGALGFVAWLFGGERVQVAMAVPTMPVTLWFIVMYLRDPWWKTWFGRSLMLLAVTVLLWTLATLLYRLLGDYPGRDFMLTAIGVGAFVALLIRALVLRAAQLADLREVERRR